jgi:hypothetical protein
MRTTLTIEDDVASRLEQLQRSSGASFKSIVNKALRAGIASLGAPHKPAKPFKVVPSSLGPCKIGSLVSVSEALAVAEGEDFR